MPFKIIRNDITKVRADAIVNTANPEPVIGRGTDSAIYMAAGEEQLLTERKMIGPIRPGCAVSTPAFNLDAKYVIHTVGPVWIDGSHGERETLHSCYQNSLSLAAELKCDSIAFPLIATGVYGFPKDEALNIALSEIGKFLLTHDMKVTMVVFDRRAMELSEDLVGGIEQYIDEHAAQAIHVEEYGGDVYEARVREIRRRRADSHPQNVDNRPDEVVLHSIEPPSMQLPDLSGKDLDDVLGETGYKKANIDRKVFSRIRCKPDYKPKKKTAVAFAVALRLDLPTTLDLLSRAEIALSPSNRFDLIVTYFITNKIYDIFEINAALFKYGQPTLGD